jgi:fucose 4-O-acetylase-like acetyltransferase
MPNGATRAQWIDAGRGIAILLVVMHHAGIYERSLFPSADNGITHFWVGIELLLYHLRLPLFFFVSGSLASGYFSSRRRPSPKGAWQMARTYVLWSLILLVLAPAWPMDGTAFPPDLSRIPALLWGASVAWYLWAIALCFAIANGTRWLRSVPLLLAALVVSSVLQSQFAWLGTSFHSFARCLPFYLLGFRFPMLGTEIVALRGFRKVAFPLLGYLLILTVSSGFSIPNFMLDLAGLLIGLLLVGLMMRRLPTQAAWAQWIGLRTLPIYLLHFPIIAVIGCTTIRHYAPLPSNSLLMAIYVPALSVCAVALSLAIHALLTRAGASWLFTPPAPRAPVLQRPVAAKLLPGELPMDSETA